MAFSALRQIILLHRKAKAASMQLAAELADSLQHDVLHRLPASDDAAANRQRMHATLPQPRDERLGWRRGEHGLAASVWLVEQRPVLGHDEVAAG
jgi:hypothetical protein